MLKSIGSVCFALFAVLLTSCASLFDSAPVPETPPFPEKINPQSAKNSGAPVKDANAVDMMVTSLTMTLISTGTGKIDFAISGESNAKKLAFRVMQKIVDQRLGAYAVKPKYLVGSFVNEKLEWTLRIVTLPSNERIFSKTIPLQAKEDFGKKKSN